MGLRGDEILVLVVSSIALISNGVWLLGWFNKRRRKFPFNKHIHGYFDVLCLSSCIVFLKCLLQATRAIPQGLYRFPEFFAHSVILFGAIAQVAKIYFSMIYTSQLNADTLLKESDLSNYKKRVQYCSFKFVWKVALLQAIILWSIGAYVSEDAYLGEDVNLSTDVYSAEKDQGLFLYLASIPFVSLIVFGILFYRLQKQGKYIQDGMGILAEVKALVFVWFVGAILNAAARPTSEQGNAIFEQMLDVWGFTVGELLVCGNSIYLYYKYEKRAKIVDSKLVEFTIKHPASSNKFANFLKTEYSIENYFFIVVILQIQKELSDTDITQETEDDHGDTVVDIDEDVAEHKVEDKSGTQLEELITTCFEKFVVEGSSYQVNLPFETAKEFQDAYKECEKEGNFNKPEMIDKIQRAKREILRLMANDSYNRYSRSPFYVDLDNLQALDVGEVTVLADSSQLDI